MGINMINWDAAQRNYIEKLKKCGETLKNILDKDPDGLVLSVDEKKRLNEEKAKVDLILKKFEVCDFTVAIVGLEKAGKSTLCNALLHMDLLPAKEERCTYTKSEIRAGNRDCLHVYFYSEEEFRERFESMLKRVGYSSDSFSIENFEAYVAARTKADQNFADSKEIKDTCNDIRAQVKGQAILNKYIGNSPHETDDLTECQLYITGTNNGDDTQKVIPFAVKEIVIESTAVRDKIENLRFYDVPGFDSPVRLHSEQTKEMLKEADIIIMASCATRPSFTGPSLNMFSGLRDDDDIPLKDKNLVFATQIDQADDSSRVPEIKRAFKKECREHSIAKEENIIFGSARAYLLSHHLTYSTDMTPIRKLESFGITDGIAELWEKLKSYCENERFEVLIKRANNILKKVKKSLEEIKQEYNNDLEQFGDSGETYRKKVFDDLIYDRSRENADNLKFFQNDCWALGEEIVKRIETEKPFSSELAKGIEQRIKELVESDNSKIIEKSISEAKYKFGNAQNGGGIDAIDSHARAAYLSPFFANVLADEASKCAEKEYSKISEALIERFCRRMYGNDQQRADRESVEKLLFEDILAVSGNDIIYRMLILTNRFINTILDILIYHGYLSRDNKRKEIIFEKYLPELTLLANYYYKNSGKSGSLFLDENKLFNFCRMLVLHTDAEGKNEPVQSRDLLPGNKRKIKEYFDGEWESVRDDRGIIVNDGFNTRLQEGNYAAWAASFSECGIDLTNPSEYRHWTDRINYEFSSNKTGFADAWRNNDDKYTLMTNYIAAYSKNSRRAENAADASVPTECAGAVNSAREEFEAEYSNAKSAFVLNEETMFTTLKKDIEILVDIFIKAIIPAMGLEITFNSMVINQINRIRNFPEDQKIIRKYDKWIKDHIMSAILTDIDNEVDRIVGNKDIVIDIVKFIDACLPMLTVEG